MTLGRFLLGSGRADLVGMALDERRVLADVGRRCEVQDDERWRKVINVNLSGFSVRRRVI